MNTLAAASLILGIASLAGLLVAEVRGHGKARAALKALCSLGFVLLALSSGSSTPFAVWIFVGLGFSLLGDVLLLWHSARGFLIGLLAFLLAHLAYIGAFSPRASFTFWALGVAGVAIAAFLYWLWPHLGPWRLPVLAYGLVIGGMLFTALGMADRAISWGALLFVLSDGFVARQRFIKADALNPLLGLPLYYAGQYLLAWAAR